MVPGADQPFHFGSDAGYMLGNRQIPEYTSSNNDSGNTLDYYSGLISGNVVYNPERLRALSRIPGNTPEQLARIFGLPLSVVYQVLSNPSPQPRSNGVRLV